jgi:lipoyl(octanoyl) transferase
MPNFEVIDLGRRSWAEAWAVQQEFVEKRKAGLVPDTLLFVEHPHVFTLGRNASIEHILAAPEELARFRIAVHEANRGGDVTYHGPGQLVGYPIFDLKDWKQDVRAYVQGLEAAVMGALAEYGIRTHTREGKEVGIWVTLPDGAPAKICALGVHISRWVTSHGFALNINPDLSYFQKIVPCGLTLPVTSMEALGVNAARAGVMECVTRHLTKVFHSNSTENFAANREPSEDYSGHYKETLP